MKNLKIIFLLLLTVFSFSPSMAWLGMPTPFLHVEGRNLKDPNGNTVVLRGGWMQPTESWFNGGGRFYNNPTDYTNPSNIAPMLNYLNEAATVMSDTTPKYGQNHGWYNTFVRVNTDAIGGWTQEAGLVNQAQFNGWIQNFLVPYANHLKSRGLYLVLAATGPINTPNNGSRNAGVVEQARLRTFWTTVANAPGVKNADNIMFELMNEPVEIESVLGNGDWGMGQAKYYSAFRTWIQPVIDDVRATGANNVVWVPTMEWQGSPHQHVQFPFTGTNVGVAVHIYPPYGNCNDNAKCHTDFWNRSYKPTAEKWPMIITENFWFPGNNGLVTGSTANYGNTLKTNVDATGNVSYMIGFLSDLLDLEKSRPATASLLPKEGAQAAFAWWYEYNGNTGGCSPTLISPYIQVNNGTWNQVSGVTVNAGDQIKLGPQPEAGGKWTWKGCLTSGTGREQSINPVGTCIATATYTNVCGAKSTQDFNIAVSFDGTYSFLAKHSGKALEVANGKTANGTNIQQIVDNPSNINERFKVTHLGDGWHRISSSIDKMQVIDVSNNSTNNGAAIHVWSWLNTNNQQWKFEDAGDGYMRIVVRNSNKCLEVKDASMQDGAIVHQWDCTEGAKNQAFELIERKDIVVTSTGQDKFANASFAAFPNPFGNEGLLVKYTGEFTYRLTDVLGSLIESGQGVNEKSIGKNIAQGTYILLLESKSEKQIQKVLKY